MHPGPARRSTRHSPLGGKAKRFCLALLAVALGAPGNTSVHAQGITTAAIFGTVRDAQGRPVDGVRVTVVNRSTGYPSGSDVRDGRYLVQGLEVGGPYSVVIRQIGAAPQERHGIMLAIAQRYELDIVLQPLRQLATVEVVESVEAQGFTRSRAGTETTISDSLLRRMPALNRDLFDFARLVPQVGTRFGGLSGGGVGFRFNSYLIDGVSERMINSNGAISGTAAGKPISIDAVKEYQVLLAPYDVRYADFAGVLVNAVTKSGTNELHGTAFLYARNEALARNTPFLRDAPYDRRQFGFSLGGPIVRDRAHFFVASEFQRLEQPALGPFMGQGAGSAAAVPVTSEEVDRFTSLLEGFGLEPGSAGRVMRTNPNVNVFARVDLSAPRLNSRALVRYNHVIADNVFFARPVGNGRFPLSSNAWTQGLTRSSTALQLFSQLPGGVHNELLLSHAYAPQLAIRYTYSPLIEVTLPGPRVLIAGPQETAQGSGSYQRTMEIADHIVFSPAPSHTMSMGIRAEQFTFHNRSTRGQFGRWRFPSLDALERGEASQFRVEKDFGSATKRLRGTQFGAYFGDAWRATDRLSLTAGLRADMVDYHGRPTYNAAVEEIYGRRTSDFTRNRVHWSPRLGFTWELDDVAEARIRGGAGVFVGRGPLAWIHQSLRFDGVGTRTVSCTGDASVVPSFEPDPRDMPTSCADGSGLSDGPVNLVGTDVGMAKTLRASVAYDRMLPWDIFASVEGLFSRTISDYMIANLRLAGPQGVDSHGRVLYGTFDAAGKATPAIVSNRFPEVLDLRSHSQGYSASITGRIEKRFSDRLRATASYTHSRVRDVQSLTVSAPVLTIAYWEGGRPMTGRHEDITTGISAYDIPHRVVVSGSWASAWRLPTSISLYYIGESGLRFTYNDSTASGLGDLNADGSSANDPIYVPRDASDPTEIAFAGTADEVLRQQQEFEAFIRGSACLHRQRGRIVERNSCVAPWVHTANASVRQTLPAMWGHRVSLDLEIFNVLNLINSRWGLYRVPNAAVLQHVGQSTGTGPQPLFRFDKANARANTENMESVYQVQLAVRYTF